MAIGFVTVAMTMQGRLDELMSQMRMQTQIGATLQPDVAYHMDKSVQHEIKQVCSSSSLSSRKKSAKPLLL